MNLKMNREELLTELSKLSPKKAPIPPEDLIKIRYELANLPTRDVEFEVWCSLLAHSASHTTSMLTFMLNLMQTIKSNEYIADAILWMSSNSPKIDASQFEETLESLSTFTKYTSLVWRIGNLVEPKTV